MPLLDGQPRPQSGEGGLELEGIDLSSGGSDNAGNLKTGLPYHLAEHRKNRAIWFSCFCFDDCVLPIILFYSLWFGSSLSAPEHLCDHYCSLVLDSLPQEVIVQQRPTRWRLTANLRESFTRGWRLLVLRDPKFRPIDGGRWFLDCSHYILSIALLIVVAELVAGTASDNVKVRLVSMAPPSILYTIGIYMLVQNTAHCLQLRTPVTLSSTKRGSITPPPMFTVMEDVFAADGCHLGLPARHAMLRTYRGSARFRKTLMWWSWIWAVACLGVAIGLSVVVTVVSRSTGFGIAYGVSFPFITMLSVVTAGWMERQDARGAFNAPLNSI